MTSTNPEDHSRVYQVRVQLPFHLRNLARVEGEVIVVVNGEPCLGQALEALEFQHPVLHGTIRDPGTRLRRPFIRFFVCREDWSHEPPETLLPVDILEGREPLLIVGALAGG